MDRGAFGTNSAGSLVLANVGAAGYWAFVPHRLPPKFPVDWELSNVLSDADRSLAELAGLGRNLPNPQLLIGPFVRREAVLSSRIEGTQSELADLYAYEAGQPSAPRELVDDRPPVPREDVQEVHNYVRAMGHGLSRLKERPLSLNLIRELHGVLMSG
jgi:Fic family protein